MNYQFESSPASSSTGLNPQSPSSSSPTTNYSQSAAINSQVQATRNSLDIVNILVYIAITLIAGLSVYFVSREEMKTSIARVETKQENYEKKIDSLENKIDKINDALNKVDRENVRLRTEYDVKNKK